MSNFEYILTIRKLLKYKFHRVKKIESATSQVVSGTRYRVIADLTENGKVLEKCEVIILEKIEGEKKGETEIKCPGGLNKKFNHHIAKRAVTAKGAAKTSTAEEATSIIKKYLKDSDYT